ncbi:hypothetical protein C7M61_003446 [Candidozyma pseudohaemuli]|uniref:Uncharacterized protein n=1 Tax=Candidozyma pseudohaemuli TaxID=418784 RepID=A0A2P7YM16_9ASCO|nr:hypothetical protein C7M61_003446 [[Candida] pseudohaemulonii]PSK37021.1 hypothetical protein C7M61_003446 [[Candida] pseudohaemulonii]
MHQRGGKASQSYSRKRRNDDQHTDQFSDNPLLLENPVIPDTVRSVVEPDKVKTYLQKLIPEKKSEEKSTHVKILLGNSESQIFTAEFKSELIENFHLDSITLSESSPFSIDRIVTLYGQQINLLAATAFIGFIISAVSNNLLKHESFTLRSQNYKIDILLEAREFELVLFSEGKALVDFAPYDFNRNLNVVNIKGDLQYLMNTVSEYSRRFQFKVYKQDTDIKILSTIRLHDYDHLFESSETEDQLRVSKEELLKFIYLKNVLNDLSCK